MESTYRVVLAEDHVRFRAELKKIIEEMPGIKVVGEAGDGNELFDLLEKSQPDLILLDISLPNLPAMKATPKIKKNYPDAKVIIMVMDGENEYLTHAVAAGAEGLLLKQNCATDLITAIEKIRRGKQFFSRFLEAAKLGVNTLRSGYLSRLTALSCC